MFVVHAADSVAASVEARGEAESSLEIVSGVFSPGILADSTLSKGGGGSETTSLGVPDIGEIAGFEGGGSATATEGGAPPVSDPR